MDKNASYQVHKFAPVYNGESRILILGTFPSVKSRENNFYYGHPRNRFWKLLSILMDSPQPQTIAEKKDFLLRHGIGVWDVIQSCEISGSSDSSIRNVVPNDIKELLDKSAIVRLYANGAAAKKLYDTYIKEQTQREIISLPSTSPANAAYSMERLRGAWQVITKD